MARVETGRREGEGGSGGRQKRLGGQERLLRRRREEGALESDQELAGKGLPEAGAEVCECVCECLCVACDVWQGLALRMKEAGMLGSRGMSQVSGGGGGEGGQTTPGAGESPSHWVHMHVAQHSGHCPPPTGGGDPKRDEKPVTILKKQEEPAQPVSVGAV